MTTTKTDTANPQVDALFAAGAHFGFSKSRRHPSATPFIFGAKNRVEIFDLIKTAEALEAAKDFVKKLGQAGKQLVLVGGKTEAKASIKEAALKLNLPYVAGRWIGGTITNFPEIRRRVDKFLDLENQKNKGELAKYTKKERLLIDRDIEKLERLFSGLVLLKEVPKAIFVVDPRQESIAVAEAKRNKIPVVAICGSDCDISAIDYPIPANDASVSSIKYLVGELVAAYRSGVEQQGKQA